MQWNSSGIFSGISTGIIYWNFTGIHWNSNGKSNDIPVEIHWISSGISVIISCRDSHGTPLQPNGIPLEFQWDSTGNPVGFHWNSSEIPLEFQWSSSGIHWNSSVIITKLYTEYPAYTNKKVQHIHTCI